MKTTLSKDLLNTPQGQAANTILRSCVHCGFCNATCPTYQLLGDELDGPRGRIYLIKQLLEGAPTSQKTQMHLDRCLTCRACETTCPSGVEYAQLLDIGRLLLSKTVKRSVPGRLMYFSLRKLFLNRWLFSLSLKAGRVLKPLLPRGIAQSIPDKQLPTNIQTKPHDSKILLVAGCVQPATKPRIDAAAEVIFDRLGIECISATATSCCGSLSHHMNAEKEATKIIKHNIDHWLSLIEQHSIEAICMTASGCGLAIKDYQQLLANDERYAHKAKIVSAMYKDPAEIVSTMIHSDRGMLRRLTGGLSPTKESIAFHPPCTLQHGMRHNNLIEPILEACGFRLLPFKDKHLCCGSAGTYSITQKQISRQLLSNKLDNIGKSDPDCIVTANIGCQLHMQSGTNTPVKHWMELLV